jgi:predicted DNA-binding transcriptional regulator YafY
MEMLDEMGLPIYTERGPCGGFSLVRGYRMPPLIFTPDEAVVLSLGAGLVEDLFGSLYRNAVRSALAKLDAVMPDDQRSEAAWARRALIASGAPRADMQQLAPHLETLRDGLREQRRVAMSYQNIGGEPTQRELDPYALVFRQGWWYVVGFCHLRQAVRVFRLDRILKISVTPAGFETPQDFDPRAYLQELFQTSASTEMSMRFQPQFAFLAREGHAAWDTMTDEPDGSVLVRVKVPDINWGASTALAYGPAVTVLSPQAVIVQLREWAQAVVAQYSISSHPGEK